RDLVQPWNLHQEQCGDELAGEGTACGKREMSRGDRHSEHDDCEKARGINTAEPGPQESSDRSPVTMLAEAATVHMGQNKPTEQEKKIDRKRSAAPEPRWSTARVIVSKKTAMVKQDRNRRDAPEGGKARQFRSSISS